MVDAEPRTFAVPDQDGLVRLANVAMHRAFEADKSGKTTIHIWVEAEARPGAEQFESIDASVEFVLYNDDQRIGTCKSQEIKFSDEAETVQLRADNDLRIDSHEDVTHIEVHIEATRLTRSKSGLKLEPE